MTTPVDVNEIKAGEYELLDLQWDEPTSKPGDPVYTFTRHYQGEVVKLDEANARRMVLSGSVAKKGELALRRAAALKAQYLAALAALPDEVRATEQVRALDVDSLVTAELPDEDKTVHFGATGFTPTDSPRYSNAAHGEGDGGPDPQGEGQDGVTDDGRTQAALDDGAKTANVTRAREDAERGTTRARKAAEK